MKRTDQSHLLTSAVTDQGRQRKNNEDRYGIAAFNTGSAPSLLAIVCDGIGGHLAGEVAAELAVNTLIQVISESDADQPLETLSLAVKTASQAVRVEAQKQTERHGMGATCVLAWIIGDRLYTTSQGDSPLFLIRGEKIQRLTTPHTWVQEAVEAGALSVEAARKHPNAHVIRRYLGAADPVNLDFRLRLNETETNEQATANQGTHIQPGDILLMCSDGLTDMVEPAEILKIILEKGRENGIIALRDLANERGGMDNITIVMVEAPTLEMSAQLNAKTVRIHTPPKQTSVLQTLVKNKYAWLGCGLLAVISVILIGGIVFLGVFAGQLRTNSTPTAPATGTPQPSLTPTRSTPQAVSTGSPDLQTPQSTQLSLPTATYTPWPTQRGSERRRQPAG